MQPTLQPRKQLLRSTLLSSNRGCRLTAQLWLWLPRKLQSHAWARAPRHVMLQLAQVLGLALHVQHRSFGGHPLSPPRWAPLCSPLPLLVHWGSRCQMVLLLLQAVSRESHPPFSPFRRRSLRKRSCHETTPTVSAALGRLA